MTQVLASTAARRLGAWELVREIGHGATTIVYQARPAGSAATGGDYIVKTLAPASQTDALAIAWLQREAFVARQVAHPHLGTILASEFERRPAYVVAPYYAGSTLEQLLAANQRFPTPHALWITRQVAEALAALHAAGWLHGDMSTANVLVSPEGHTTLIDLGFARRIDEPAPRDALLGTPTHMAPELFKSPQTTLAADVYSLGVVLYELLTGNLPFEDDDPLALVAAHLDAPPPALRQQLPHVPTRLARLVRRMLAKEPLRRPGADEVVALLTDLEIETFAERLVA